MSNKLLIKNKSVFQKLVILGILIGVVLILTFLSDDFLTLSNLSNVSRQVALVIITGSAVTLLMISGNFDLSVGSILALTGVIVAKFTQMGVPLWASMIFAVVLGGVMGLFNGFLVTKLKIVSFIATLGTMYIARGLTFIICGGKSVNTGLPGNFDDLGRNTIGIFPIPLIIFIVIVLIFYFIESKTILGKYTYAIGGNRTAAKLSGINDESVTMLLYVMVGILAGFSGIIMASRLGVGQPNVGIGFEFDVIVAVILGGTSLLGGVGSVVGTVIGAFLVGFLANGLNLIGVHSFYQSVFKGVVLIGAVLLDKVLKEKMR